MAESEGQLITKLNKYDVLCGRGSGPNERRGNIHFRDLVSTRKDEYLAINPRDHKNKNRIAREIVEIVRNRGGRFLRRAAVNIGQDDPEAYELADETTVMEKAKQALRQNRAGLRESFSTSTATNMRAGSRPNPNVGNGVSHQLPQSDPCEVFAAHLQQTHYETSPAETAIRNLQMQNLMAQQQQEQQRTNSLQANSMPRHNPYFATAGGGGDPDQYRNAILMQQYGSLQHHHSPNSTMAGQPNLSTATAADSAYLRFFLEEQMKQKMPGLEGHTASIPQGKQPCDNSMANLNTTRSLVSDSTASIPQGRQPCDNSMANLNTTRSLVSDSRMEALENIFVSASQNLPNVRTSDSRLQHHGNSSQRASSDSRSQHHGNSSQRATESFIDGLEDMSLPSMSIGEISDFSTQAASLSRSKRSVGGTIIETAEGDGSNEDDDVAHHAFKTQEIAEKTGPCVSQYTNRQVSFVRSDRSENAAAAVLHSMIDANPNQQMMMQHSHAAKRDANYLPLHPNQEMMLQQSHAAKRDANYPPLHPNQQMMLQQSHAAQRDANYLPLNPNQQMMLQHSYAPKRDANYLPLHSEQLGANSVASQKKQRQSLSSYYRDMKHAQSDASVTSDRMDVMSLYP